MTMAPSPRMLPRYHWPVYLYSRQVGVDSED